MLILCNAGFAYWYTARRLKVSEVVAIGHSMA